MTFRRKILAAVLLAAVFTTQSVLAESFTEEDIAFTFKNYTVSKNIDMISNQEMIEIRGSGIGIPIPVPPHLRAVGGLIGGGVAAYHEIGYRLGHKMKQHQHSKHSGGSNSDNGGPTWGESAYVIATSAGIGYLSGPGSSQAYWVGTRLGATAGVGHGLWPWFD